MEMIKKGKSPNKKEIFFSVLGIGKRPLVVDIHTKC